MSIGTLLILMGVLVALTSVPMFYSARYRLPGIIARMEERGAGPESIAQVRRMYRVGPWMLIGLGALVAILGLLAPWWY